MRPSGTFFSMLPKGFCQVRSIDVPIMLQNEQNEGIKEKKNKTIIRGNVRMKTNIERKWHRGMSTNTHSYRK